MDTTTTEVHPKYPSYYKWDNSHFAPQSYESAFCIVGKYNNARGVSNLEKDTRTLEKLSGELLLSLEHVAREERNLTRTPNTIFPHIMYLPVIVTTASLQACIFDPYSVDTKTGHIPFNTAKFEEVSKIRFRKGLATNLNYKKPLLGNISEANRENERTVFVVKSTELINFLYNMSEDL